MLILNNITKKYKTRSKTNVYALNDVSITFPDKGLCIISGKSGSGKTTLLNILGGLDINFEGQFSVNGNKLSTKKDFANYRHSYISLVFQDYNLIDDLTIEENLLLSYKLSKQNSEIEVESALKKVGLEGYEKRYPRELSGGQQQRIAIARALMKNARILLADEPTGNLDSTTSKEIYELLKELSKEKLVIVASHSEEFKEKYADYIVELENGKIFKNNIILDDKSNNECIEKQTTVISNKVAFRMGLHEINYKLVKNILTVVLMTLCFSMIALTISLFQYHHIDPSYKLIKNEKYQHFKLTDTTNENRKKMEKDGIKTMLTGGSYNYLDTRKEAEEIGFKFYQSENNLELNYNVFYANDLFLKWIIKSEKGITALIDGEEVVIKDENYDLEKLIGKTILTIRYYGIPLICGGIYYAPYEEPYFNFLIFTKNKDYIDLKSRVYLNIDDINRNRTIENYEKGFYDCVILHTSINSYSDINNKININIQNENEKTEILLPGGNFHINNYENCMIVDASDVLKYYDWNEMCQNIKDDEIYISVYLYNKIFKTNYKSSDFIESVNYTEDDVEKTKYIKKSTPEYLDAVISINGYYAYDKSSIEIKNLKIKGIFFEKNHYSNSGNYLMDDKIQNILLSNDNAINLKKYLCYSTVWVQTKSIKNLHSYLKNLYDSSLKIDDSNRRIEIDSPIYKYLIEFENTLLPIQLSMFLTSIMLTTILIILTTLLISGQIVNRKREIGIFKALGASNKDIIKIYFFEMLMFFIPVTILSNVGSVIVINIINKGFVSGFNPNLTFIYYKLINIPYMCLFNLMFILVAIIIPVIKISKMNIIDAIRANK